MRSAFLLINFLCCLFLSVAGQEYGYTRYDIKEGLAGSTVYTMIQDKEGFLWFATETGLSRFDGTHFKNFTKADGLPDNEVIQLFADSKGRIWISPFKKAVCYYYKGKIYNPGNDSVLNRIHIADNILHFAEDKQGNILMQEVSCLHLLKTNGQVSYITKIANDTSTAFSTIAANIDGGFWVVSNHRFYQFENDRFSLRKEIPVMIPHFGHVAIRNETIMYISSSTTISTISLKTGKTIVYPNYLFNSHINVCIPDDRHVAVTTMEGAVVYNTNKPDSILTFLPGLTISRVFEDAEGNWWFSTFGKGIYRLNSPYVRNLKIKSLENREYPVTCFTPYNESVVAGANAHTITLLNANTGSPESITQFPNFNPIYTMCTLGKNRVISGGASYLGDVGIPSIRRRYSLQHVVVKAIYATGNKLLVCTDKNVVEVDTAKFTVIDTIWHSRATTVYASNDTIYIGTLNGLYCIPPGKPAQYLGEQIPFFRNRIAAITEDADHVLWVATYGEGIVASKNGRMIRQITAKEGLTSNICRNLFLQNNSLWVGTDKGVNKINVAKPDYPIKKYTTGDGLASDDINAIYVNGSKVFVGTPEGVTFFDEVNINGQSHCNLIFTDVTVSGKTYYPADMPSLIPHAQNNLQFNYVGISYKSAGDVRYRYRLLGLDSNWKETRETFLSYPTLPSGDYQLQIEAINKFDVVSKVITASFAIEKLMWETTWFRVLLGLIFLAVTGSLVWLIINRIRSREQEKTAINKRIGDLEQLARKAQMNPHFIFNSLNSIQQYVMDADITGANKFISGFSRLIRQTLDFSSKHDISLEQELDYLSNYLELEKTRLENAFGWSISVADDVNTAEYHIPPMILQPFVENSVRHGLRFRRDRNGLVSIHIKKENNYLVCVLKDNGIGRKAALKFKSVNVIEYQSKGMSLTAERIAMLNKDNPDKITMQIEDLEDDQHRALGTKVTIRFPMENLE